MFLTSAMNLQLRGALDVFYTGDEKCLPGGPNFDNTFYLSWSVMVGSIAGVVGVSLFQMILSRTWYRRAFWTTTLLQVVAAIVDIAIVERWNRRAGISDKVFYLLGDTIIQEVVLMLDWMPAIVLTSKLCPLGVESTVYALLAGFQNFGSSVASALGVLALDVGGIKTPDDALCDFSNLTWLIIIGHMVLPLLTIPLTFWLIPNARMTDDLVGGLPMAATNDGADASDNKGASKGGAGDSSSSSGAEQGAEEGADPSRFPGAVVGAEAAGGVVSL